jgi:hypothetical protein
MGIVATSYGINESARSDRAWYRRVVRKGKAKNKIQASAALNAGYKYSKCKKCRGGKIGSAVEMQIDHKIDNTPMHLEFKMKSSEINLLNPKNNDPYNALNPNYLSVGVGINNANFAVVRSDDPLASKLILESSGQAPESLRTGANASNTLVFEYNDQVEISNLLTHPVIAKFSTGIAPSALLPSDSLAFTTLKLETESKCSKYSYGVSFGALSSKEDQYFIGASLDIKDKKFVVKNGLTRSSGQNVIWSQFELRRNRFLYKLYSSVNLQASTGLNEISVSMPLENKSSIQVGITRERSVGGAKYTARCGFKLNVPLVSEEHEYIYNIDVIKDENRNDEDLGYVHAVESNHIHTADSGHVHTADCKH